LAILGVLNKLYCQEKSHQSCITL